MQQMSSFQVVGATSCAHTLALKLVQGILLAHTVVFYAAPFLLVGSVMRDGRLEKQKQKDMETFNTRFLFLGPLVSVCLILLPWWWWLDSRAIQIAFLITAVATALLQGAMCGLGGPALRDHFLAGLPQIFAFRPDYTMEDLWFVENWGYRVLFVWQRATLADFAAAVVSLIAGALGLYIYQFCTTTTITTISCWFTFVATLFANGAAYYAIAVLLLRFAWRPPSQLYSFRYGSEPECTWSSRLSPREYAVMRLSLDSVSRVKKLAAAPNNKSFCCQACQTEFFCQDELDQSQLLQAGDTRMALDMDFIMFRDDDSHSHAHTGLVRLSKDATHKVVYLHCTGCGSKVGEMFKGVYLIDPIAVGCDPDTV